MSGACVCNPGLTMVGGRCVDLQSDPRNCSAPGVTCTTGQACVSGSCQAPSACGSGYQLCTNGGGSACVNTRTSVFACGGCGNQCQVDEVCVAGNCQGYNFIPGCTTCPCASACRSGDSCCPSPGTTPGSGANVCVQGGSCP